MWCQRKIAAGVVAGDGEGMLPAERVVRWRVVERRREALVRWRGFDFITGSEHADTWVPRKRLSRGLLQREEDPTPAAPRKRAPSPREGQRKSARSAGVVPGPGLEACAEEVWLLS